MTGMTDVPQGHRTVGMLELLPSQIEQVLKTELVYTELPYLLDKTPQLLKVPAR